MKKELVHIIFSLTCILAIIAFMPIANGQLSPGKLTKAHRTLEGLSNCTSCHDLGASISEVKCLECHQPLKSRIDKNKGFHVSSEIKNKTCISCHSEHHGLNFEMVRFDKKTFNHDLTGYDLKGSHKGIDCIECHKPANIASIKLKLTQGTYLGLDPKCLTCHDDYHQKTMSTNCASCHNFEKFKPAPLFEHNKTSFPLTGGHANVDCIKCHKTETLNGKDFQQFANIPFKNCNACHSDPHHGSFGIDCKSCHSTESFSKMKSGSSFNHSLTGFELEGKHKVIDCKACHDNRPGTRENYKEFDTVGDITCLTCHQDVHESKFGNKCIDCHSQNSFKYSTKMTNFDHDRTDFQLDGKHTIVDCKKCHSGKSMTDALSFEKCVNCHTDYHQKEFENTPYTDCAHCHSVSGFDDTSFGFDKHSKSSFPLVGAHLATPCFACHKQETEWKFRKIGTVCIDCHDNMHDGKISPTFIPKNDCRSCHNEDTWSSIQFDHDKTPFKLAGKHSSTSCKSCHFKTDVSSNQIEQKFKDLDNNCISCHNNIHGTQFEKEGTTDCAKCHGFDKWDSSQFNHDNTEFKLEGAHKEVACVKCHEVSYKENIKLVNYKTGRLACSDCHQ